MGCGDISTFPSYRVTSFRVRDAARATERLVAAAIFSSLDFLLFLSKPKGWRHLSRRIVFSSLFQPTSFGREPPVSGSEGSAHPAPAREPRVGPDRAKYTNRRQNVSF